MATNEDGIITVKKDSLVKARSGMADFIQTTRDEIKKVTWPSRKETIGTTIMIIVVALIAGVFFLAVDSALGFAVSRFLGMNS